MLYSNKLAKIQRDIDHAKNYQEYKESCLAYDAMSGNDDWKADDKSQYYDYSLIYKRLNRIKQARLAGDISKLMYILHEGIHGNLGNIGQPILYDKPKIGTKNLIIEFLDEVCLALETIYHSNSADVPFYDKLFFFEETSHAYGQSCLMLSGGAGLGFFHCGVVKTLIEHDLIPSVISGASAGAIITSLLGTRTDQELLELFTPEKIYEKFKAWGKWKGINQSSLFDSANLENSLIELFDLTTFEEAYQKTGRQINVSVSPADIHQQSRILSAKTSPNAVITQAVRASCAIPYIFEPVQLKAKNQEGEIVPYIPNRKFADGSIMADLPFTRLARLYGVNHSIVSQTNPLAVPFLSKSRKNANGILSLTGRHVTKLVKENSIFACDVIEKLLPNRQAKLGVHKVRAIIEQQYVGDINILPHTSLRHYKYLVANPSLEGITQLMQDAERATWPALERIYHSTRISLAFQKYLSLLKEEETARLKQESKVVQFAKRHVNL